MINPVEHNFKLYVGQDLNYPFTVWLDEALSIPYDFYNKKPKCQARQTYSSKQYVDLNPVIDGNTVFLRGTPEVFKGFVFPAGEKMVKYVYDVEIEDLDTGIKWTMVRGIIEVYPEVTKV